jgi:probable addiction module antidote protein
MKSASSDIDKQLKAAFATNDLRSICRALDGAILQSGGIVEIARGAEVDRTTIYRAIRLKGVPKLDTVVKVLRALGYRLIVEVQDKVVRSGSNISEKQAVAASRRFTAALRTGSMRSLPTVFAETLRAQENVAELAKKMATSREHLYRVFSRHPNPRFSTFHSFLSASGLRFAIRRIPMMSTKAGRATQRRHD